MAKPRDYTVTFSGAGERKVPCVGKYVRVLATPVADAFFRLDGGQELQRGAGQEIADGDPKGFKSVTVRSTVAQAIRFTTSEIPQGDSRAEVNVNATATVEGATATANTPAVVIAAGTTVLLIAGDVDRLQVRVALPSTAASHVWLGAATVADEQGGILEPGVIDYIDGEFALYAHNPHATDPVTVSVMPLRRP